MAKLLSTPVRPLLRPLMRRTNFATSVEGLGGDAVQRVFADGTDGFYFDFSKTDRLFQNLTGTPADDAGENIYLALESHAWGGRTLAQELALPANSVLFDDFSSYANTAAMLAVWTAGGTPGDLSLQSGALSLTRAASTSERAYRAITTVVGRRYRVLWDVTVATANAGARFRIADDNGGSSAAHDSGSTGVGAFAAYFIATSTTMYVVLSRTANGTAAFDNIRIDAIPGNHALQATTSAQPKWQTGGLARFDGVDDCLVTPLQLGNVGSFIVKFNKSVGNSGQVIIGQRPNTSADAILLLNDSGVVAGSVGTGATLTGSTNLAGTVVVAGLTWDGTTANLYAQGGLIATQAQSGTVTPTAPVILGSALSASLFAAVDVYHALAIKKALTAAEIAAITNQWGTT